MLGFCIEASHQRGLGHLYKSVHFVRHLKTLGVDSVVMVNNDQKARETLDQHGITHVVADIHESGINWEAKYIKQFGITTWINDRLDTDLIHAERIKHAGINLVTFDDHGTGAALADIHFAPLVFTGQEKLLGEKVCTGIRYLVLNQDINACKRVRHRLDSILVSLGGSDTYGVTVRVLEQLHALRRPATVVIGPSFAHDKELAKVLDGGFRVKRHVPSLIKEFVHHDLAITGGGITPFEANASGLPCIVIANEPHEIEIGQYLARVGSSIFAGYHRAIETMTFDFHLDLAAMSTAGLTEITTDGVVQVCREIMTL